MGVTIPSRKLGWSFFLKCKVNMEFSRIWKGTTLILDVHESSTGELKPKQDWDKNNNKGSESNAMALFSIFNGVYTK